MADRNEVFSSPTKVCTRCGLSKPVSEYYKSKREKDGIKYQCKKCDKKASKLHYKTNQAYRERMAQRVRERGLARFDLTTKQYEDMLVEQNGVCAICYKNNGKKSLAVDHDHRTGVVRQLLCMNCNTALGHFKDDPELLERAIEYLKRHSDGG